MVPHKGQVNGESGIKTLIYKYFEHGPKAGIEFVDQHASSFDVLAVHAGMSKEYGYGPLISHLHGLYWTADYQTDLWEYKANRDVIESIRHATQVTVPSEWVAETLRRDMHLNPHILPHGIDYQEWIHSEPNEGYVLWNKNRSADVCSPKSVGELALRFPNTQFITTFAPPGTYTNIQEIGLQPHEKMRRLVQRSSVYLSSTKETFGIGILEAMASGKPVLGFNHGGIKNLVQHGVNGYLARPNDWDDLAKGLRYCLTHARLLGENGKQLVRSYTWEGVVEQLYGIYALACEVKEPNVSIIIPAFNYGHFIQRAVQSVLSQTSKAFEIIIVNNNSTDDTEQIGQALAREHEQIHYFNCPEQGVAHARNYGIARSHGQYICCLDADDEIKPGFLEVCVNALEQDRTLGLAYTRLEAVDSNGTRGVSQWPGEWNFDNFVKKQNQVPTCCVFRRDLWERLGGYKQRYAPNGAGAEDAEFWFRIGEAGYRGKLASNEPLFTYHLGGSVSGNREYKEPDWLKFHSWTERGDPPFAALNTPTNGLSHPVRQYDEPEVSVIIPVGPNHVHLLPDALDSLEGQTFRKWEVICVFDGHSVSANIQRVYPFARFIETVSGGAGAARNLGALHARGEYLLFLDADDWFEPQAIQILLNTFKRTGMIAYPDYIGHAIIDDSLRDSLDRDGRLLQYNPKTKEAQIAYHAFDYQCEIALRQPEILPNGEFYIWNTVSSLLPKRWHDLVGGFDEKMESWEDWHYWLKLARKGKCFHRVSERLLNYRIYTGTRRSLANSESDASRQVAQKLVQYIQNDFEKGEKPVACGSCGSSQSVPMQTPVPMMAPSGSPDDLLEIYLNDGQRGDHSIIGRATQRFYGYRVTGEQFLMHRADIEAQTHLFILVTTTPNKIEDMDQKPAQDLEPPVPLVKADDLTQLWGISPDKAQSLNQMGIFTFMGLSMAPDMILEEVFHKNIVKRIKDVAKTKLETHAAPF